MSANSSLINEDVAVVVWHWMQLILCALFGLAALFGNIWLLVTSTRVKVPRMNAYCLLTNAGVIGVLSSAGIAFYCLQMAGLSAGYFGCTALLSLFVFILKASLFCNLTALVDRYVAVCYPVRHPHVWTLFRLRAALFSCWILAFGIAVVPMFMRPARYSGCYPERHLSSIYLGFLLLLFGFMAAASFLLQISLLCEIHRHRNGGSSRKFKLRHNPQISTHEAAVLIMTSFFFCLTWTPYAVVSLLHIMHVRSGASALAAEISAVLIALPAAATPLICVALLSPLRSVFCSASPPATAAEEEEKPAVVSGVAMRIPQTKDSMLNLYTTLSGRQIKIPCSFAAAFPPVEMLPSVHSLPTEVLHKPRSKRRLPRIPGKPPRRPVQRRRVDSPLWSLHSSSNGLSDASVDGSMHIKDHSSLARFPCELGPYEPVTKSYENNLHYDGSVAQHRDTQSCKF